MLGLRFCTRAFSSCGERGPLFITVRGPLTIAASLVAEHRLQTRWLSSCGARAQLVCGMWDLPRPGLEPVSPALAGGFPTTAPPGKPPSLSFLACCSGYVKHAHRWYKLLGPVPFIHPALSSETQTLACAPLFSTPTTCGFYLSA